MPKYHPIIVAHRGLHARQPENSLAAFQAAWKAKIAWCECDVQLTADGIPVVFHDRTLSRTTTGRGAVVRRKWADLAKIRLRGSQGKPTQQSIARLGQLVRHIPNRGGLIVDFKPELKDPDLLLRALPARRIIVHSFHAVDLFRLHAIKNRLGLALLVNDLKELRRCAEGPWQAVHLQHRLLTPNIARMLKNRGKLIGVWTVNQAADLSRVISLGADRIITDRPVLAQWMVDSAGDQR
jgi:glycerophosphoryl diester phosphodiesterase